MMDIEPRFGSPFELFFQTENASHWCDLWIVNKSSSDLIKFLSVIFYFKTIFCIFFFPHQIPDFFTGIYLFSPLMQLDKLRPEFRSGLDALTRFVLERTRPKQVGATVMTGPILASITQSFLDALNKGAVPTITSSWQVGAGFVAWTKIFFSFKVLQLKLFLCFLCLTLL